MARTHVRLLLSVWDDPDWLALTSAQQTVYWALTASVDLSFCGVAPYLPQRLVGTASDLTLAKVKASVAALAANRFIVVDELTAEVCVRSYVRHGEVMKLPNVAKAAADALARVRSKTIRETVLTELAREMDENPHAKGWKALDEGRPHLFEEVGSIACRIPSLNGADNPPVNGHRIPSLNGTAKG